MTQSAVSHQLSLLKSNKLVRRESYELPVEATREMIVNAYCHRNLMGFVESWGTRVKRILDAAASYGLPVPRFEVYEDMFRVNLFRKVSSIREQTGIGEASE